MEVSFSLITLLLSERPKLYAILVLLSAVGLNCDKSTQYTPVINNSRKTKEIEQLMYPIYSVFSPSKSQKSRFVLKADRPRFPGLFWKGKHVLQTNTTTDSDNWIPQCSR